MEDFFVSIATFFQNYGWRILFALCVLIAGGIIVYFFVKGIKHLLYRTRIDVAVVSFIASLLKICLWIGIIFICAGVLELSTSSLIVCLSSIALAIGLALKDSFANLTNGIFIIYNKPFKRGDHISVGEIEGIVQNIKLLCTEMLTFDNKKLIVPNNKFITETITNYSALPIRRVDQVFSVAYGSDISLVEKVLTKVIKEQEKVLKQPAYSIYMSKHNNSSLDFTVKAWVNNEDYFDVAFALPKIVYLAFEKNNIEIPFNQLDVHINNKGEKNEK